MRICDMTDSHLINAINLMRRNALKHQLALISEFSRCPAPTADGAFDCWEREESVLINSSPVEILEENEKYLHLLGELAKRTGRGRMDYEDLIDDHEITVHGKPYKLQAIEGME